MSIRRFFSFVSLMGLLLQGLGGCSQPPKPKKKGPPKPQTEQADGGAGQVAAGEGTADGAPADDGVSDPGEDDPLGSRFKDPPWYTPDIIAHENIIQNGRSEKHADGTFSSAIVLQLPTSTTPVDCLQTLVAKAEPHGLSFGEPEKGDDGRLTARAEDDRMRVTFVCGVAKGTPTAFVGYEWKPGV